jgi:hypothetical protein
MNSITPVTRRRQKRRRSSFGLLLEINKRNPAEEEVLHVHLKIASPIIDLKYGRLSVFSGDDYRKFEEHSGWSFYRPAIPRAVGFFDQAGA